MKPYGWRMRANDYDGKDEPVAVVDKKRSRQDAKQDCATERQTFAEALERGRKTVATWPAWTQGAVVSETATCRELDTEPTRGDD